MTLSKEECDAYLAVGPSCKHNGLVFRIFSQKVGLFSGESPWECGVLVYWHDPRDPGQELKGTHLDLVFWRVILCSKKDRRVLQETWHYAAVRVTRLAQCKDLPREPSALSSLKGHICISEWSVLENSPGYGGQGEGDSPHPCSQTPPRCLLEMTLGKLSSASWTVPRNYLGNCYLAEKKYAKNHASNLLVHVIVFLCLGKFLGFSWAN